MNATPHPRVIHRHPAASPAITPTKAHCRLSPNYLENLFRGGDLVAWRDRLVDRHYPRPVELDEYRPHLLIEAGTKMAVDELKRIKEGGFEGTAKGRKYLPDGGILEDFIQHPACELL